MVSMSFLQLPQCLRESLVVQRKGQPHIFWQSCIYTVIWVKIMALPNMDVKQTELLIILILSLIWVCCTKAQERQIWTHVSITVTM